jgi:hypothetical protein
MMLKRTAGKWLVTFFVLVLGMAFTFEASAEKKIDWSQYMEKPGDTVPGFSNTAKQDQKASQKASSKKASSKSASKKASSKSASKKASKSKSKRRVATRK